MSRLQMMFDEIDTDKSGQLDKDEVGVLHLRHQRDDQPCLIHL